MVLDLRSAECRASTTGDRLSLFDGVDAVSLRVAALSVAGLLVWFLRVRPHLALVLFLVSVCFVPVWLGVTIRTYVPPASVGGLLVLASTVHLSGSPPLLGDVPVLFLGALALAAPVLGLSGTNPFISAAVVWGVAYAAGRQLAGRVGAPWLCSALAAVFVVVALLALVEFLTGFNPFVLLKGNAALYRGWSPIQLRGGRPRAEGAFGHSLALGGGLAIAVPFVLSAPWRVGARLSALAVLLAAISTTFSRTAILSALLGVVLTLVCLDTMALAARVRTAAVIGLLAGCLAPFVVATFSAAGAEASNSAGYRNSLLSLAGQITVLGPTAAQQQSAQGVTRFGPFRSIDNALLLAGLTYGGLFLAVLLVLLLIAVVAVLRRRATAPTVALVAQLPAFGTVALITQYASLVWFVAGLAVALQHQQVIRGRPDKHARPHTGSSSADLVVRVPSVGRS